MAISGIRRVEIPLEDRYRKALDDIRNLEGSLQDRNRQLVLEQERATALEAGWPDIDALKRDYEKELDRVRGERDSHLEILREIAGRRGKVAQVAKDHLEGLNDE